VSSFNETLGTRRGRPKRSPQHDSELVVLMIDGVHFAEHVVLGAVGIDAQGRKQVPGLREGATENAAVCKALLADFIERRAFRRAGSSWW
jgi:transposase-like protein